MSAPISIERGTEVEHLSLTTCEGTAAPRALGPMSILLRPGNAAHAPRVDAHLIERLGAVTEHFVIPGSETKLHVISGSRPSSAGSYHASGRAIDFRIDGVTNEDLVAFCKTLDDSGCGYYPNSSFVHMDVRDVGTGHVSWIDASGPGEAPRYVSAWPVPAEEEPHKTRDSREMIEDLLSTLEKELPRVPSDDHPAEPKAEIERDLP